MLKKLSMLFFILGSLIAILGGAFDIQFGFESAMIVCLLILGVFIGLINISREEETRFLIAAIAYSVLTLALVNLLNNFIVLDKIAKIMINFLYLFCSAGIVVALKLIIEFASSSDPTEDELYYEKLKHRREKSKGHRIWDMIVFSAVAILFIVIILRYFFDVWKYESILNLIDYVIYAIFLADVVFLFMKSETVKEFFIKNWLDIIAVLPFGVIFEVAKFGRVVRLIKLFSEAQKLERGAKVISTSTKIVHSGKGIKYFSEESGFNRYIDNNKEEKSKKRSYSEKVVRQRKRKK